MTKEKLVRRIFISQMYELTAVEEFLEKMASKGLMFAKATGNFYYFRKCEPKKVKFAVDIFDKASVFDTKEANSTLEYIEYCKEAGWKFLYSTGKIQFFYTEQEEPVEIQTDDKIKLKYIVKMQLLLRLPSWLSLFYISWLWIPDFLQMNTYIAIADVADSFIININMMLLVMLVLNIIAIIRFLSFTTRNLIRIINGQKMKYNTIKSVGIFNKAYFFTTILLLVFMLINSAQFGHRMTLSFIMMMAIFVIFIIIEYKRMQNKKFGRLANIIFVSLSAVAMFVLLMVGATSLMFGGFLDESGPTIEYKSSEGTYTLEYSSDKVPMTLKDLGLGIEKYDYLDSFADETSSIFASSKVYGYGQCFADESKEDNDVYISYEVYSTKISWLMKKYLTVNLDENSNTITELTDEYAKAWNAKCVYSVDRIPKPGQSADDFDTIYYIVYNDKVISLYGDYKYTVEEVAKIKEHLKLN
jgi:hypothetical protein